MPRYQASQKSKLAIIYGLLLLTLLSGCQSPAKQKDPLSETITVEINQTKFQLETTNTAEEQRIGLMNRKSLPAKTGMFFEFEQPQILSFWMKNTLIPIDIIFIDENLTITNISKNTPPCQDIDPLQQNCPSYLSSREAKYVIELNAGESNKFKIQEGQTIDLLK